MGLPGASLRGPAALNSAYDNKRASPRRQPRVVGKFFSKASADTAGAAEVCRKRSAWQLPRTLCTIGGGGQDPLPPK